MTAEAALSSKRWFLGSESSICASVAASASSETASWYAVPASIGFAFATMRSRKSSQTKRPRRVW
jgi:hypothetical protein